VGKTSLALDITTHTATEAGTPVGFFSFEIGREELLIRLISARSRVQLDSIYSGFITTTERENLDATLASLYRAPIHIDDNPRHSIASIREQIKECKDKLGLKLLVIDCLQLIKNKDHATTSSKLSEKTLRAMSLELKAIAKEFSLAIISLYQLPQTWQSKKIIPHPTFILGRGAAEKYNADKIILIYRRSVCRECQSPIELCTCSLNHDTRLVVSGSDTIQDVTHLRFLTDSVHFETPAC
jgi:replicative DNA helicase